jgi:hypothetical protein
MRKTNFSFWLITGISVGAGLGVAFDNIPAGVASGAGSGLLALLISVLRK